MEITQDIKYIGVNDRKIDLFEGQYKVPCGMSYNSYAIIDREIAIMDTVEAGFTDEWLENIKSVLGDRKPNYLVIQHMEPDHSANIINFLTVYPDVQIVATAKAFVMMKNFFQKDFAQNTITVKEGDSLNLGRHNLQFITAPMVHWPEVMLTYDSADKVLFSADAFGKFGATDCKEDWKDEARRYYIGIVGKYGAQVQNLLKKAANLQIEKICSLHGPVLDSNLEYYFNLYDIWSSYRPEEDGVVIAYTSIYGNTKKAVNILAQKLKEKGANNVIVHDLARCDMHKAVSDAFCFSKTVLATTTYNGEAFPHMREFLNHITERGFQNRKVAIIENGSWAPTAAKIIKERLEKCKGLEFCQNTVTVMSALDNESIKQIELLAEELK